MSASRPATSAPIFPASIFGIFHETGHALYEQGVDPALTRSALTTDFLGLYAVGGASFGTHESQSRLWENQVGRSRDFWRLHFPRLQEIFPQQLAGVDVEQFYRAVNRVQPSLIRIEADEVTYNLHIMLRVEIEMGLMDGCIVVEDLPAGMECQDARVSRVVPHRTIAKACSKTFTGRRAISVASPHTRSATSWPHSSMEAAQRDLPGLDATLAAGDYRPLLDWLTENIYRHGRAFSAEELLQRTTGTGLDASPYLDYIRQKFASLYALNLSAVG